MMYCVFCCLGSHLLEYFASTGSSPATLVVSVLHDGFVVCSGKFSGSTA